MRTFNLLKYLSEHHQITLISQSPQDLPPADVEKLQQWVNLIVFPATPQLQATGGLLATAKQIKTLIKQGIFPKELTHYSQNLQNWLDRVVKTNKFDLITCEDSPNEVYIRPQWRQDIPTVVNIHRSLYGKTKHQLQSYSSTYELQKQLNLPILRWYEQQYSAKFSALVTTTQEDRRILKTINPEAHITVIPNGLDLNQYPRRLSNNGGQRLVFIGAMDKPANIDAACFLSLEIFPAIRQRYPETTLEIVGTDPAAEILAFANLPGIKVTGQVSSIVDYLHWATVCVIPIRKGSGIKYKTLEAMAAGIPVVASDIALEGLTVDGSGVPPRAMRANKVDEYVYAVGRLFEDCKLREKLSLNGRIMVESEYTWTQMGQRYEQVLLNLQGSKL
ncbi:glycosyltransferase family 4 protein [Gloeothece citriformis]|nr:glycosyltransferase family 4 protein [Gloeothece citriformis]